MNKNTLIVVLVIVVLLILGAVFIAQKQNNTQNVTPTLTPTSTISPTNAGDKQQVVDNSNTSPKTYDITIEGFAFTPSDLNIKKGDTVTWTNQDSVSHQPKETSFESSVLQKGQSFSFTFNSTGSFSYYCNIHPTMKGRIVVE